MKKLFAIITVCLLAAGVTNAQDSKQTANPATASAKKTAVIPMCDMKNFYAMRAGRMTLVQDGIDVGMTADAKLSNGATLKTNGTYTDKKGKAVVITEGEAVDINGNKCSLVQTSPVAPSNAK